MAFLKERAFIIPVSYTHLNERDLRSVIEGDREPRQQESFGAHGYQEQEFAGGELVDVDPEEELLESLEGLEDSEAEADDFDEE